MTLSLTPETILQLVLILSGICLITTIGVLIKLCTGTKVSSFAQDLERLERMNRADTRDLRQELSQSLIGFNDSIRKTLEDRLDKLQADNASKLEQMRATVDDKLHTTLEKRLGESFALV